MKFVVLEFELFWQKFLPSLRQLYCFDLAVKNFGAYQKQYLLLYQFLLAISADRDFHSSMKVRFAIPQKKIHALF